jgi:hypothetical protein
MMLRMTRGIILVATIFSIAACGPTGKQGATGLENTRTDESPTMIATDTIDTQHPMSIPTQPWANCVVASASSGIPPERVPVVGDGVARFYPPPAAWGNKLTVTCSSAGQVTVQQVNTADASTYVFEPGLFGPPKVIGTRPALQGDPSSYSAAYLAKGGYPPPPDPTTNPAGHSRWLAEVSRPVDIVDTKSITMLGHAGQTYQNKQTTANWSGQMLMANNDNSHTHYEEYVGVFEVPGSYCPPGPCAMAIWGGMGGWNNSILAQNGLWADGTATGSGSAYWAWWEFLPTYGSAQGLSGGFSFNMEDQVEVWGFPCDQNNNINLSGGYADFYWYNTNSTALTHQLVQTQTTTLFPTLESIIEKPNPGMFSLNAFYVHYARKNIYHTTLEIYGFNTSSVEVNDTTDDWYFIDIQNTNLDATTYPPNGDPPTNNDATFIDAWQNYY